MPQGLQIWDDQGRLLVDLGDWLGRLAGSAAVTINTAGSTTNSLLQSGTPFFVWVPSTEEAVTGPTTMPSVTFSGSTMSWSSVPVSGTLIYGVR
jgi:hypothetical protein